VEGRARGASVARAGSRQGRGARRTPVKVWRPICTILLTILRHTTYLFYPNQL
jgi:hypothetical protein